MNKNSEDHGYKSYPQDDEETWAEVICTFAAIATAAISILALFFVMA